MPRVLETSLIKNDLFPVVKQSNAAHRKKLKRVTRTSFFRFVAGEIGS